MNHNESGKKTKQEKVGFYVALSVCLVAVGLAAWSTFDSVNKHMKAGESEPSLSQNARPAENNLSGILDVTKPDSETQETAENNTETDDVQRPSVPEHEDYTMPQTNPDAPTESAVETLLRVTQTLEYPVSGGKVSRQFSEEAVRNETMNDLRAHLGVDFEAEDNAEVVSMCNGVVDDVYQDDMKGGVIVVKNDEMTIFYCGVDAVKVEKGEEVFTGNPIAAVSSVPFEALDGPHIHIEIIVNNRYIDPVSVINNNQ